LNKYTVFPNAPIVESLLDIRVELPEKINLMMLEGFYDKIKEHFPEKQQRMSFQAGVKLSSEGTAAALPTSGGIDGYLFKSPQEKKMVQARLDGFTFNKLKPYKTWEIFRDEARSLWNLYFQATNPVRITRIALRYINRIEIPLPMKNFKEYVLTTPEIAPKLPQKLNQFFMQLVIPNPDIQTTAIINQTTENPTENQRLPLIFDIDVFQNKTYVENNVEMWSEFEKLHIFKNEIFFNSITDKAKELFQ